MAGRTPAADRTARCWRRLLWATLALPLVLPLVATRLTDAVDWSVSDFAAMAALVGAVGLGAELAARRPEPGFRAGAGLALATGFLLVWANAAVGLAGAEGDPLNRLFYLVPAVALLAAACARFRPAGMNRALRAAAAAQVAAGAIAAAAGRGSADLLLLTAGFATLWLVAAGLFARGTLPR